jgi:hydroxymethylbilane synthase
VVGIRGNLDTRLRKLAEGACDALVLALAGIERLGIDSVAMRPLRLEECLPASGQGALGVEVRADDDELRTVVRGLNHPPTWACVEAERAFLRRLDAGCQAAASAHARHVGGKLRLDALVADVDGTAVLMERETADPADGPFAAARLAERLLVAGAEQILARGRRRRTQSGKDAL